MTSCRALQLTLGCLAALLMLDGCGPHAAPPAPAPAATVAHPRLETSQPALEFTGVLAASRSVDVVARVAGFVRAKGFRDGSRVRRGQVLFQIEPDAYVTQLQSNRAKAEQAGAEYQRQLRLAAQDATARTSVESAKSNFDQAKAGVQSAALDLRYTAVRAPMDGWVGPAQIDVGAYVGAGQPTRLATVQTLDPIYVNFSVGERDVLRITAALHSSGVAAPRRARGYPVAIALQGERGFPHRGQLDMSQKALDSSTGSLQVRAVLPNHSDEPLLPGLFARVRIDLGPPRPALTLPDTVVLSDELGDYVYLAGPDGRIQRRNVATASGPPGRRVVTSGLASSDWVVVDGLSNIRVGGQARITRGPAV